MAEERQSHPAKPLWIWLERKIMAAPAVFWLLLSLFVNLILIVSALILLFMPRTAQMSAAVTTETWSVFLESGDEFPIDLLNFSRVSSGIPSECGTVTRELIDFGETVRHPTQIDFVALGNQEYRVTVRPLDQQRRQIAAVLCDNAVLKIDRSIQLVYNQNSQTFVGRGVVRLGDLPRSGVSGNSKVLLGGEITASSSSFPFKTGRVENVSNLIVGDEVRFYTNSLKDEESIANIVMQFDALTNSFNVVVHSQARVANVKQLGLGLGYPINTAPSFWSRVEAQGEWTIFVGIMALLLNVISAFRHYTTINSLSDTLNGG